MSLPKAPVKRIMKEVDDMMISEDALNKVIEETTNYIKKLTAESFKNAQIAKRKTIKPDDIKIAVNNL
ncbi:histone family protein [Methanobrevibacter filiformis]|uniref:Histone-like transcription factor (CBF/NF-Y) and archaeal histone n=1 Tax=Methanobrevibacter filiformis TaxID=55758 RepID=A0A162FK86_9EURY|nr:histone [Methanobrevibacter filiformis]KZX11250.1 histone-like transcription factor (CBF/NF-Y) and archaeal histone [Methanobrevibacter filiformis]